LAVLILFVGSKVMSKNKIKDTQTNRQHEPSKRPD